MKNIAIKLSVFFIIVICISSLLSFVVTTLYTSDIEKEIRQNQQEIAVSIIALNEKTDIEVADIVESMPTYMYDISIIDKFELEKQTSPEQLEKIQNDEIAFIHPTMFHDPITIFKVNDKYIEISLYHHNTIFKITASRTWLSTLLYVGIGAILISLLANRVVKPVLRLTNATQEVAKGNFDIQVKNESNDEVGQLTKNFNKMTRELKQIECLRKDFINNVSHEFKAPIASIQGFAKLLQQGDLTQEQKKEYTGIIVEETARLSNLSSNILKLSKLENQEIVEKRVLFSLDEQIRKSILVLEHEWNKKDIEFDITLEKVEFLGDEEILQHVWINLLGNAIKFSNCGSAVKVSLEKIDSSVRVKVTDYGVGMDKETKNRIFEKFYQGDKAHSSEGNGLGLPLVKRIIDLYDGEVRVESELKKGTTFVVELPLE
ncbi:HAMP domain-containing sensor histidine kinase [Proteinivorax tanatarense]|uniref:Heme sensor protein HssS n=1 Tax=Proteinivorax tanatarense TaxID=1260629 RepID=A0AAU7VP89_9FIRM